jgi:hypothetical protein
MARKSNNNTTSSHWPHLPISNMKPTIMWHRTYLIITIFERATNLLSPIYKQLQIIIVFLDSLFFLRLHIPRITWVCETSRQLFLPTMLLSVLLAFLAPESLATAQSGVDLDKPMLGGGGRRGPGAMLRFGCSQVW